MKSKDKHTWLIAGAKLYRDFILDKGSYVGYKKALEYEPENIIDWNEEIAKPKKRK